MYSSRGNNNNNNNNAYGQPPKPQSYSLGSDAASQPSRHAALLGGHSSAGAHYGSQYTSAYGSTALNSALQVPVTSVKGAGPSVLEGRSGYDSTMQDSPKYASRDYAAATQKYGQKGEKLYPDKLKDYPLEDRLPYAERPTSYSGRDLQNEATARFADSIAFGRQCQTDIYDRFDAAAALRKELLLTQSLQPASVDGGPRQADFLSARAVTVRHAGQELLPYGGRMDADLQSLSRISGTQHAPSILGAAPGRDVEDLIYSHSSANPGYGVSLPPGRAYTSGKALHDTSLDSEYPGGILTRGGYARLDDKDDVPFAMEIERREEDLRWEILRERERERVRERDRERERDRQRDREREHERERERERDRDRERERERELRRERERERERRVKEKDRELKRALEVRLERTTLRSSRDRGRSSSAMAGRSSRRESLLIEASHRRPSPVKEKRREYVCKVYSSNLADIERDYLSMDKRYPRLYVSPECSKVVVNWSRENLHVPFNTPISFEHDFVLEEKSTEHVSASTKAMADAHVKLETGTTRWNAKMLLMSGLSHNAWEELSSERNYEDRIPHLCNMLRFAFFKDGNSSMAIGGSWDTVDGNDPSVDKSALVQTLLRYSKEFTSLDFMNCRHWNPFLEIHYDRVGKDGLFSHKEVTVLYIPDLSDCLPSIDAWRAQWYAHKKAIEERERLHALKRETLREKEDLKEKEAGTTKILKKVEKTEKKKETGSASKVNEKGKAGIEGKAKEAGKGKAGTEDKAKEAGKEEGNTIIEKKAGVETVGEGNSSGKKTRKEVHSPGSGKKIIKNVIKKKVADKDAAENAPKQNDTRDMKNVEKAGASTYVIGEGAEQSATISTVKTSATKKVAKESLLVKTVKKDNEIKKSECSEDKPKSKEGAGATVKTAIKKKIIKRVAKKKVASEDANDKNKVAKENEVGTAIVEATVASGNQESEVKSETKQSVSEQQKVMGGSNEIGNEGGNNQVKGEKKAAKRKIENEDNNDKLKDGKEKKVKDGKAESRVKEVKDKKKVEEPPRHPGLILQTKGSKSSKLRSLSLSLDSLLDYTDKDIEESTFELSLFAETFYEMLQFQMGSRILMFLQKLRIKFVAKRNQKKRQREEVSDNKKKEKSSSAKKSSPKCQKTEDVTVERKSVKTETLQEGSLVDEKTVPKEENMLIDNADTKPEDESKPEDPEEELDEDPEEEEPEEDPEEEPEEDPEEEPEEDPEEEPEEDPEEDPEAIPDEDEIMADASPKNDADNVEKAEAEKVNIDVKSINVDGKVKDEQEDNAKVTAGVDAKSEAENKKGAKMDIKKKEKETPITVNVKVKDEQKDNAKITVSMDTKSEAGKKEDTKVIKKKEKETRTSINKELLQAFRFFDRNRVGYIRVEDLRLILHALGNSMSHRDVKELVQSALLESNTGRDDHILYNKLVKMTRV